MYFVWMTLMTMPMPRGDCLQQPLSVCNPNSSQSALLHNKISEAGLSANSPASLREKLLTHTVTFYESIHVASAQGGTSVKVRSTADQSGECMWD